MKGIEVKCKKRLRVTIIADDDNPMSDETMKKAATSQINAMNVQKEVTVRIPHADMLSESDLDDIRTRIIAKAGVKIY